MKPLAYCEDLGDRLLIVNANSGKRNVLSADLYRVLLEGLHYATTTPRIASVIIRGEGDYFCAGGNLGLLSERRQLSRPDRLQKIEDLHDVIRAILACPKPVIASVEGGAAGAGVSLVFACDLVVADAEAKFSIAYVKAGLVPDGGLTRSLSALLPRALLMRMALLGEPVTASYLYGLGALAQVVPAGAAIEAAHALADKLANGPSATQGVIKNLVNQAGSASMAQQLDAERDAMVDAVVSQEAGEGMGAFLAKREPDFRQYRECK